MKRVFQFLHTKSGINILFIFIFLFFLIFSVFRIAYIEKSFDEMAADFHNDWDYYAKHAKDINESGVLMPGVNSDYVIPAGFFYNYFVAACVSVFGNKIAAVYLIQSFLLSLSLLVIYRLFKDEIREELRFLFVVGLFVLALMDVYHYYTFLLLSENLAILTIPVFLFFLKNGIHHKKTIHLVMAGSFLGISVLTRPTLIPFSILMLISIPFISRKEYLGIKNAIALVSIFIIVFMLLPIRNYFVTGNFTLLPVNGTFTEYMHIANPLTFSADPTSFIMYYFKKFLFCLGFLPVVEPVFQYRPHWMLMWIGYILYLFYFFKKKERFNLVYFYIHFLILTFYSVIILVAPIQSYGFRMMIPVLFLVYGVSFIGLSKVYSAYRLKSS